MGWSDLAFAEQYAAATSGAGFVRLDGWSTVLMGGKDRAPFLHNMCTNDIRALAPGDQGEAFLTDVKGKIVAHVIVLVGSDELTLIAVPGQAEKLIAHLDRYIIREDVTLTDATALTAWGLVIGPAATAAALSFAGSSASHGAFACRQVWAGGAWLRAGVPGELSLESTIACDEQAWQAIRLESGWPLFGVDFDGSNLPQEVNRDAQAINFRKGCYLGQETIARIDALGHVNKRLASVRIEGDEPAVGVELTADGKEAGRLTSVAWSPKFESWIGFAMLRRGVNDSGTKLACGNRPAEVLPTPAVSGSSI